MTPILSPSKSSVIALIISTEDGTFVDVNSAFIESLSYTLDELVGRTADALHIYADPAEKGRIREKIKRDGFVSKYETRLRRKSGEIVDFALSARMVEFGGNNLLFGQIENIADRRRTEGTLHDSEEKYRWVVSSLSEGIIMLDIAGKIIACNRSAERILGLSADRMMGLTSFDPSWASIHEDGSLFTGEDHPAMVTLRTGKPLRNIVMGMNRRDSGLAWININSEPIFARGRGTPCAAVASFTDITEWKRNEEALRIANERIELAARGGGVGIWEIDVVNDRLIWDDQIFRLYGGDPKEFASARKAWESGIHPEDKERCNQEIREALRDKKEYNSEFRVIWPDGTIHHINSRARVYRDESGKPLRMLGTNYDITRRVQMEEELRETETRLKRAQQAANLGNWEWDLVTKNLFWSEGNYHILGIDPQAVQPSYQAFIQTIVPAERAYMNKVIADAIAGKNPFEMEYSVVRPDNGETRNIYSKGEIILNGAGQAIRLSCTNLDITARKRSEEKLRELTGRLSLATASAKAGVWDWHLPTNEMISDDRMLELYGLTRETFPGGGESLGRGTPPG
jgi:PAS domain S-box-containing protein